MKTVKMRSDEDSDDFFYKKDRCRDRLSSVTTKKSPSDRQFEDITLQWVPPEYDRTRQTYFEREHCSIEDIRWGICRRFTSTTSRAPTLTRQELPQDAASPCRQRSGTSATHYCNKFDHYKNDSTEIEAVLQHNQKTQTTAAQAARRTSAASAEAGGAVAAQAKGGGGNVVLILQDHHSQQRRL